MMTYYLIRGDQLISTLDAAAGNVVALPLLGGGDPMSLMNAEHASNLMANLGLGAPEALAALGVADLRSSTLSTIVLARNPVSVAVPTAIVPYHLLDIGDYSLWQCDGQQEDLLALHNQLYVLPPADTLGLLAVVSVFGTSFYDAAMRTATGMTVAQALERRNRIAVYLEGIGYPDTAALRAATTEGAQMVGIATAPGFSEAQLWNAMVEL